jgi:hypothetical protein
LWFEHYRDAPWTMLDIRDPLGRRVGSRWCHALAGLAGHLTARTPAVWFACRQPRLGRVARIVATEHGPCTD